MIEGHALVAKKLACFIVLVTTTPIS